MKTKFVSESELVSLLVAQVTEFADEEQLNAIAELLGMPERLEIERSEDYGCSDTHRYTNPDCVQFVEDMKSQGFEVTHYRGRFHWEGPAVIVSNTHLVVSKTKVVCQQDDMGMDFVVYPKASDKGKEL